MAWWHNINLKQLGAHVSTDPDEAMTGPEKARKLTTPDYLRDVRALLEQERSTG